MGWLIYIGLSQCGARPGELCRAQISDVDWQKGRDVTELAGGQDRLPQVWDDAGPVAAG